MKENIERIAKLITTKFNNDYSIDNVDKEAIEELLKAYKELKEIEESHRKENGKLREKVKELEEENKRKNIEPVIINNKMYFIDKELYIDLLKDIKTYYIPTSVIQKKIEEVNNSNGYSPVNKIFIEKALNEILEEGRKI